MVGLRSPALQEQAGHAALWVLAKKLHLPWPQPGGSPGPTLLLLTTGVFPPARHQARPVEAQVSRWHHVVAQLWPGVTEGLVPPEKTARSGEWISAPRGSSHYPMSRPQSWPRCTSQHPLGRQGRHHAVRELLEQQFVEDHEVVVPSVHGGLEALQGKGPALRHDAARPAPLQDPGRGATWSLSSITGLHHKESRPLGADAERCAAPTSSLVRHSGSSGREETPQESLTPEVGAPRP